MDSADLRAARHRLALTQADLAAALGLRRESIVRMERGQRPIQPWTALAVEALLRRQGLTLTLTEEDTQ